MIYYDLPKKIIEVKSSDPKDIRLVNYTEDDFYELLYVALDSSRVKVLSEAKQIYQVSDQKENTPQTKLLDQLFDRYSERIFKLVNGVPTGFTIGEANMIIDEFLRRNNNGRS